MLSIIHYIFLAIFIIIAAYLDIRTYKIPNWLTISGMTLGLVTHLLLFGVSGLIDSGLGLIAGGGITVLLYVFKAVGGGDVKLFAAIGALAGIEFVLHALMYSIIYAGIIAIIILLFTKTFMVKIWLALRVFISSIKNKTLHELEDFKKNQATTFPFMYAVVPATITTFFYVVF